MLDPIPPPPRWLRNSIEPWALYFNVPALTEHIHEVLFAFALYQFIHYYLSPWLSSRLFPRSYPNFNRRTKINWDVHVVSFVQSSLIIVLSLWVMFADKERESMTIGERVYGCTGALGLIQAFAAGYFLYDLIVSTVYIKMFGIGMLFHAISALWVFSFGFRPFLNFYGPNFLLYELSSPFLNIHWCLDKVGMTGSKAQWYNGMALLVVFFSCRLVWGTWQSALVYRDMWAALKQTWSASASASSLLEPVDISAQVFRDRINTLCSDELCTKANAEISKFASYTARGVPTWLVLTYVASNLVLNSLNYYWFSKMIDAVLKRFRDRAPQVKEKPAEEAKGMVTEAASKLEYEESSLLNWKEKEDKTASEKSSTGVDAGVSGEELRSRNPAVVIPPA